MNAVSPNPTGGSTTIWLRAALLAVIVGAGFALARWTPLGEYLNEERIIDMLTEISQIWWAPLALLALYAILGGLGLTVMPLIVAGSIFGPSFGSLLNTTGVFIGAMVSFWLARALGRDFVLRVTGDRFRRAERFTDRHGFWPLVQTRFLPLPFPVVNFGAALAGVSPGRFAAASFVGILPSTVLHTLFITGIMFAQGAERLLYGVGYAAAFVAFNLVIGVPWIRGQRRRRHRYLELVELRSRRSRETD